jgi:hypothetical protein
LPHNLVATPDAAAAPSVLLVWLVWRSIERAKGRDGGMRNEVRVLVVLSIVSLVTACGGGDETMTALPTRTPQPAVLPEPTATPDPGAESLPPACPEAIGDGTIAPAVSIYSTTFVVNGVEQVVRDGEALQAAPGDEVHFTEATICAGSFSGNGGEACVHLAPVDRSGTEIASEHRGSHTVPVTPGFFSVPTSGEAWTVGEDWAHIYAVLNHWPPQGTQDPACGDGRCERDDWIVVGLR